MEIVLLIGGIPIQFNLAKALAYRVKRRYQGFIVDGTRPRTVFECVVTKKLPILGETVSVSVEEGGIRCIRRSDFICTFDGPCGVLEIRPSIYSFDACLRVLYATLLTESNALLVHASAVARKQKGYVFAGVSGSGKTTVARLSGAVGTVLNDEIVIMKTEHGRVMVYGTPFWGEMRTGPVYNKSVQLQGLYFLKKARDHRAQKIGASEAIPQFLRCCCTFSNDVEANEQILRSCAAMLEMVPVYRLHFMKDTGFWDILPE